MELSSNENTIIAAEESVRMAYHSFTRDVGKSEKHLKISHSFLNTISIKLTTLETIFWKLWVHQQNDPNGEYPNTTIISLHEIPLDIVRDFNYLGAYINAEEPNTGYAETNHKIQIATAKFSNMSNFPAGTGRPLYVPRLLQNFRINLRTRIKFLEFEAGLRTQ